MSSKTQCALALLLSLVAPAQAGTPIVGALYVSDLSGPLYRVQYAYDGVNAPVFTNVQRIANLTRGGGARGLPDGRVAVVGAGQFSLVDTRVTPATVQFVLTNSNANALQLTPDGQSFWTGWKDTPLSRVPINPLSSGIVQALGGSDSVSTILAFTPSHGVFYATGGEGESGNFGQINMTSFQTTRIATAAFATGVVYDAFSGHLITAGLARASQRDPAAPSVVLSSRDDSSSGENYLILEPTGQGHLIGTRFGGVFRVVFIDYSTDARIGGASTQFFSVNIPGITNSSGGLAIDASQLLHNGFE
jgi:hypothetical protein